MIKIPPPLIVLVLIVSIYFSSKKIDLINIPLQLEISIFILSAGILIFINPVLQFVKSKTTVNPMGFDFDHISEFDHIDDDFIEKQKSIRDSYIRMGVEPTFSCTPYDSMIYQKKALRFHSLKVTRQFLQIH